MSEGESEMPRLQHLPCILQLPTSLRYFNYVGVLRNLRPNASGTQGPEKSHHANGKKTVLNVFKSKLTCRIF